MIIDKQDFEARSRFDQSRRRELEGAPRRHQMSLGLNAGDMYTVLVGGGALRAFIGDENSFIYSPSILLLDIEVPDDAAILNENPLVADRVVVLRARPLWQKETLVGLPREALDELLTVAARANDFEKARLLVVSGAHAAAVSGRFPALDAALAHVNYEMAALLYRSGARMSEGDFNGTFLDNFIYAYRQLSPQEVREYLQIVQLMRRDEYARRVVMDRAVYLWMHADTYEQRSRARVAVEWMLDHGIKPDKRLLMNVTRAKNVDVMFILLDYFRGSRAG